MKVTVERAALLRSLGHVHRVVERRNTIPILSNVLLRGDGSGLRLKATDLDIEVTETIAADVAQGGATTVPAHVIYDIVRKLAGRRPGLARDGRRYRPDADPLGPLALHAAGPARERLPRSRGGRDAVKFSLPPADLRRLIDKTQFAISTEETRYYLNGIYLPHDRGARTGTMLRAVATDGHRLARVDVAAPAGADGMPGVIVPRKAVAEIQKLIEDGEEPVGIELSSSKIRLTFGGVVLTSKLIDGTFPDYQRVIPTGNDKRLTVDLDTFAKAVDRVSTISSERGRAVKLALNDGRLVLSVTNPDSGSATEELEVDYEAGALDIGFNARYLLDITGQLDGDTALFRLADPGSPTLIQDREGSPALYVLMPMRV